MSFSDAKDEREMYFPFLKLEVEFKRKIFHCFQKKNFLLHFQVLIANLIIPSPLDASHDKHHNERSFMVRKQSCIFC